MKLIIGLLMVAGFSMTAVAHDGGRADGPQEIHQGECFVGKSFMEALRCIAGSFDTGYEGDDDSAPVSGRK